MGGINAMLQFQTYFHMNGVGAKTGYALFSNGRDMYVSLL
jgi:hypothetical protein